MPKDDDLYDKLAYLVSRGYLPSDDAHRILRQHDLDRMVSASTYVMTGQEEIAVYDGTGKPVARYSGPTIMTTPESLKRNEAVISLPGNLSPEDAQHLLQNFKPGTTVLRTPSTPFEQRKQAEAAERRRKQKAALQKAERVNRAAQRLLSEQQQRTRPRRLTLLQRIRRRLGLHAVNELEGVAPPPKKDHPLRGLVSDEFLEQRYNLSPEGRIPT